MNIQAVHRILSRPKLSDWAKDYWTRVLHCLLNSSSDELVTHRAGPPHLWSETGLPVPKQKLVVH